MVIEPVFFQLPVSYSSALERVIPALEFEDVLAEFAPSGEHDIAYLCGNPNMVDATFEVLKAAGLPVPHIRREKYVSSK